MVTPHLGASTTEAQDRAGVQTAEQMIAALTGGVVSTAVNIPAIAPEDMDVLGPFIPLVDRLGRLAVALAEGSGTDRVEVEYFGRIAERDTRLLTLAVLKGVLAGHCEEEVNLVNAAGLAEERGIARLRAQGGRRARLRRPRPDHDRRRRASASASPAPRSAASERPHLLEAWGQRFNLQLDEGADLALFRYCDLPGMMGRVGTRLGERGVNIESAAVGRQPPGDDGRRNEVAVMVVTTDSPVPREVVEEIAASDGFLAGRAVSLSEAVTPGHGCPARCQPPSGRPAEHFASLLRLRDRRRVAALHHLPQAGALQLRLEVPVGRVRRDALDLDRAHRGHRGRVQAGDQLVLQPVELLRRLLGAAELGEMSFDDSLHHQVRR